MADDHAVTKTRLSSSGSPTDMGSTSRAVNASSPCDSDVLSPSRTGFAKKELIMTPPEEKLKHFESRAQAHGDSQEFDACIQDLVRCVALARLVYGDGHLKLAQAHGRLAKAYFQFKGWGQQAQEHCILARELLPFCSTISSCREEKLEILTCLLSVHLTQGGASLLTASLEEAESSFLEAEQVAEELQQRGGINQEEKIKTELEISAGLSSEENNIFQILSDYVSKDSSRVGTQSYRVYKRQNKLEEALNQCEKSLQLLTVCGQPEKTCSVYRDMAAIEQDRGHLDRAIEHLSKAHAIAVSHSPEELEGAQISHSLALILSAAAEPHHNDSAGHYFEQSLSAYKNSAGPQDPAFLAAQDDFCRFLLFSGQQEIFCSESSTMETPSERCVEIQRASLTTKRSTFGDLSVEVADTLQLIGSVEMTEGRMKQAHRTMTKCLEIQSLLYGPQHRKTKATQKAVDMLARAPEVAERQQRQGRRKTEPHTFSIVPSSGNDGNSMPDS